MNIIKYLLHIHKYINILLYIICYNKIYNYIYLNILSNYVTQKKGIVRITSKICT